MDEITQYNPQIPQQTSGVDYSNVNQGTIAIETARAIAEAQGKLIIAKKFPRDVTVSYQRIMDACHRKGLAEKAFYSYPRGGQTVNGVSIRFAEELARCYGNIDYGIKELSQDNGKSEMQAYAWDLESNTMSVQNFANPHQREAHGKMVSLSTQRDIYENNANMASRRLRARILAILPSDIVDDAVAECRKTLAGDTDIPLCDKVRKLVIAFAKYGVNPEMVERRLGHKIDETDMDEYLDLCGIGNSLKDKQSSISDWFDHTEKTSFAEEIDNGKL